MNNQLPKKNKNAGLSEEEEIGEVEVPTERDLYMETVKKIENQRAIVQAQVEQSRRLSFMEVADRLETVGINLGKELEDAFVEAERWGLLEDFEHEHEKDFDSPQTLGEFRRIFHEYTFDREEIDIVVKLAEQLREINAKTSDAIKEKFGIEELTVIFSLGNRLPFEQFEAIIIDAGTPHDGRNFETDLRRISTKDVVDLDTLDEKSQEKQEEAFRLAYEKAEPLRPSGPTIGFVYSKAFVATDQSAVDDLQMMVDDEAQLVGPVEDLILFRKGIDMQLRKLIEQENLNKPDDEKIVFDALSVENYREFLDTSFEDGTIKINDEVRYSNYVDRHGSLPWFVFDSSDNNEGAGVGFCSPAYSDCVLRRSPIWIGRSS